MGSQDGPGQGPLGLRPWDTPVGAGRAERSRTSWKGGRFALEQASFPDFPPSTRVGFRGGVGGGGAARGHPGPGLCP